MKTVIAVSGHGNYATGLQSSIELLAGKNEGVYFIDFEVDDTEETLKEKFNRLLNSNPDSQILFVCDLAGGTPFKTAAEIANSNENLEVVAGCNVGAIIEAILKREVVPLVQLADNIINSSRKSTIRFNKVISNKKTFSEVELDEGI